MPTQAQRIGGVSLSDLELQILQDIARRLPTKEIARQHHLAPKTIEHHFSATHPSGIYRKIGVPDRAAARAWALDHAEELDLKAPVAQNPEPDLPPEMLARSPIVVELLTKLFENASQLMTQGHPRLANQQARWLSNMLRSVVGDVARAGSPAQRVLRRLLASTWLEEGSTYSNLSLRTEILRDTRRLFEGAEWIAREGDTPADRELLGAALFFWGNMLYVADQDQESIVWMDKAGLYIADPANQLLLQRGLTLACAKLALKQRSLAQELALRERSIQAARKAKQLIWQGDIRPGLVVVALEGIGRSQGLLSDPQTLYTFEEAERIYAEKVERVGELEPILPYQLARSKLVAIQKLDPKDQGLLAQLESQSRPLLAQAAQHDFRRHGAELSSLLNQLLN